MGTDRILCRIKWTDKPVAIKIKAWNAKLKGRIQKAVKAAAKQQQQLNLNI